MLFMNKQFMFKKSNELSKLLQKVDQWKKKHTYLHFKKLIFVQTYIFL